MVAAECAARNHSDIKLMSAQQLLAAAPETTRNALNPFKLSARASYGGKPLDVSVIPDAVFGLDFISERKRKYFFLEADRATMPIARSELGQTSFVRKLIAYLAGGGRSNAFGAHFGIGNFRVLTVTTSRQRTTAMIDALKALTHGAGSQQFLFIDRSALHASSDLLSLGWLSGKGEFITLYD